MTYFRHLLSNGSLYFSTIIHSRSDRPDEGIYQCVATVQSFGTILSKKAKLQVACKYLKLLHPFDMVLNLIILETETFMGKEDFAGFKTGT